MSEQECGVASCPTAAAIAETVRDAISRPLDEATRSLMALALTGPWRGAALAGRLPSGGQGTISAAGTVDPGCDQRQWALGDGPACDALAADLVVASDLGVDERWPRWRPAAISLGVRAAVSLRLHAGRTLGAFTVYSPTPLAGSGRSAPDGPFPGLVAVAAHLSVLVEVAERHRHLQRAVHSRSIVGQAIGLLRSRFDLGADQAFALLRRQSQTANVKLIRLAESVVDTGVLPGLDVAPESGGQTGFRPGGAGDCAVREPAHPGQRRS